MTTRFKSYYLIIFLTLLSCVEQVDPIEIDKTHLVIYGNLYYPSSYLEVNIFETSTTRKYQANNIKNAKIRLFTQTENTDKELVTDRFRYDSTSETETYQSLEKIETSVGNKYWIEVEIPSHSGLYESSKIEMIQPVKIKEIEQSNGVTRVIFEDPKNEPNQYLALFNLLEFISPDENQQIESASYIGIDRFIQPSTDKLFDGNTNAYIEIYYTLGDKAEVSLYHVDPQTYQFYLNYYNQLNQNEGYSEEVGDTGFLYRQPPAQLTGNIYNNNTKELVLGNFGVIARDQMSHTYNTTKN